MPLPSFNVGNIKAALSKLVGKKTASTPGSTGGSSGPIFDSGSYSSQKYNEVFHDVDLYLDNSGDFTKPKRYFINPSAVVSLIMSDTVNDWVVDGSMTFLYTPDDAPSNTGIKTGQKAKTKTGLEKGAADNGATLANYQFRGDGFDILRVMIVPNTIPGKDGIKIGRNDTKWTLSYAFSIYDVEDIIDIPAVQGNASSYMKCLKLKFHDIRYQMLRTANLEYSTAEPKDSSFIPNTQSEIAKGQGVLHTGDILRDIFNEVLAKPENGGHPEFKIEDKDWDKGKGELFYTSPAQWAASDDIDYVFGQHVSIKKLQGLEGITAGGEGGAGGGMEANDMCLLHTDRAKTFGHLEPLTLTPLMDFFEKAGKSKDNPGELQKEHFFITSYSEESNPTNLHRAPLGGNGKDIDLKTFKFGQIVSYSFVDMAADVNSNKFCTTPVYSVDIGKREFNIEFKGNDISSVKKIIGKSYISKLYKEGNEEKLFLPVLHKNKKDLNIFPTFTLNGNNKDIRQRNGLHNLLYTGLFQNACICFKTYGLTLRESGTFIGIDKVDGCADTDYSNKLFGQWFVVRVDHLFEAGAYMNIIYAVKLHRHKEIKNKFEGLLPD